MQYLIEQMDHAGRWAVIGSEPTSARAQSEMWRYRKFSPSTAWRVVEHPSRRLIACEGGPSLAA